jgi:hypothetical protein
LQTSVPGVITVSGTGNAQIVVRREVAWVCPGKMSVSGLAKPGH